MVKFFLAFPYEVEKTLAKDTDARPVPAVVRFLRSAARMVGRVGFEPTTIRLKVECSTD